MAVRILLMDLEEVWVVLSVSIGVYKVLSANEKEGLKFSFMGALERCQCKENVYQSLEEVEEDLSFPCDELKRMCHEYM